MEHNIFQTPKDSLDAYQKLIAGRYAAYPAYQRTRLEEFKKNTSDKNPFFRFGHAESIIVSDHGKVFSHGIMIRDSRLPKGVAHLGHFESENNERGIRYFFDRVREYCAKRDIRILRGPINFTIWQTFRASLENNEPPFFTEPYTPPFYRNIFKRAGFARILKYVSAVKDLDYITPEMHTADSGRIRVEKVDKENFDRSLLAIHEIASDAFFNTVSYVPILPDELAYHFSDFKKMIGESIVFILYTNTGSPSAFCFAVPDILDRSKNRLVIKTLGVKTSHQNKGIGKLMMLTLNKLARTYGYTQYIYSTMRSDNMGVNMITGKRKNVFRTYEVYELCL